METRITAFLMGELPPGEAMELGRAMERDPELARLCERLRHTVDFVREATAEAAQPAGASSEPLKLSDARREKLLAHFKTVRPKELERPRPRPSRWRLLEAAAVLAIIAVLAAMLLPALSKAKSKSHSVAILNNARQLDSAKQQWAFETGKSPNDVPTFDDIKPYLGRNDMLANPVAGETYILGSVAEPVIAEREKVDSRRFGLARSDSEAQERIRISSDGTVKRIPADSGIAVLAKQESPPPAPPQSLPPSEARVVEERLSLGTWSLDTPEQYGGNARISDPEWYGTLPDLSVETFDAQKYAVQSSPAAQITNTFSVLTGESALKFAPPPATLTRESDLDSVSLSAITESDKERAYAEAKRDLDSQMHFRKNLELKIAAERINADLPKTTTVTVIDRAQVQSNQSPQLLERMRRIATGGAESVARVKVEREASDISGFNERTPGFSYDPYFIQIEFESIQSEGVLGKVIDGLRLEETWAKDRGTDGKLKRDEAMALLRDRIDLRAVPNSSTVEIRAKSASPEEAAKLANAVAEAYQAHKLEERRQLTLNGVKALEGRFEEQQQKVLEAQKEVERLARELKESEPDAAPARPPAPPPVPQPEVQTRDNPFSTFSLNVSDVSFKLAAASLEQGLLPEPASIRSEEFINAFDYRDPEPPPGMPIAFAWERARYPFAQNRDLLRFSVKTAAHGREAGRPLNVVLLLDNSGSMERADRVQIVREALRVLAGQLQPHDKLSVVTFARTARLWVDGVTGNEAGAVAGELSKLIPQGGTNLEEGLNAAYEAAFRHYLPNGINRVVLFTDGAANLGNVEPGTLKQKIEAHRKQGVAFDCFGIGWEGYNDELLETLARNGDGRYGFINTPEEADAEFARQLAGALRVAASDVKVQVEFNPARVSAYRQIGYAKHQLTKEQFRDNTIDAAELAAAESGNALYVVEVNPGGQGPLGVVRVRFKTPGTADFREHEWTVPYTGNAPSLDRAGAALRLAATAGAFSEWLAASPFAAGVTLDELLRCLSGVSQIYSADPRPQQLEWMLRQARSIERK